MTRSSLNTSIDVMSPLTILTNRPISVKFSEAKLFFACNMWNWLHWLNKILDHDLSWSFWVMFISFIMKQKIIAITNESYDTTWHDVEHFFGHQMLAAMTESILTLRSSTLELLLGGDCSLFNCIISINPYVTSPNTRRHAFLPQWNNEQVDSYLRLSTASANLVVH